MPFIIYKLVPLPGGKSNKLPLDWRTLRVANALDPANWTDQANAANVAAVCGKEYGVGWVVQPGYWFLDIDHCLTPAGWSSVATELCGALDGAYCEVSSSGNGLHLIGRGTLPPHGTRNGAFGLELYSGDRFCALTGTHARGSMELDLTDKVRAVAAQYFPPRVSGSGGSGGLTEGWTDGPCEGWSGPAGDDDLIKQALASVSAAGAFGGVSFRQLWEADPEALGGRWPAADAPWDESAADASLAQRLAFWTGKDCGRIERLMRLSGLVRDKWDRPDYLPRTISRACGQQREVMTSRPTSAPAPLSPELLLLSDLPRYFEGVVYIEDRYCAAAPDGALLTPLQFRTSRRYGGHGFMIAPSSTRATRNAWEAFTEASGYKPVSADSLCFRPEFPPRTILEDDGKMLYNSYVPVVTPSTPGDPTPFVRHLELLFPVAGDRAIVTAYLASLVKNPGVKFQWALLIQGAEGNGKSMLLEILTRCVGERYTHIPNAQDLSNKFNGWIEQKLLIGVEEIRIQDRADLLDTLKILVTNRRIEIQRKGSDQVTGDNRANFILFTNHKDAIPKTLSDRRYCVIYSAHQDVADLARDGMTGRYYPDMYKWLRDQGGFAIINHWFRSMDIPAALDPAQDCHRAPATSSTAEAILASLGPVEQAVAEAIASEAPGFCGGWVSSWALGNLLDGRRLRGRAHPNTWDASMRAIGYEKHPALPGGRLNAVVAPDGQKSRIWVKSGSIPALNLTTPAAVAAAYSLANSSLSGSVHAGVGT